ncbi:hypothetical protein [Zhongshania sp. BJYM1]|uniref:hypothetical protein n=1 Tax=Zhongshania aquatica TaxID=2965069 RepID=UPI0022B32472|nr:hypothetical protein [Marortus sp. BJYM1]
MTNTKALQFESPALIRNLMLTVLLIIAVAVTPKQAHADGVETAAAVLIGAAVLYAAHDSYKDDRRYSKHHVHDRHCGHQVSYRDSGHHNSYYRSGYSNQQVYTNVHTGYYNGNRGHNNYGNGKYYKDKHDKGRDYSYGGKHDSHSDRYARDDRDRGNNNHQGQDRGKLNDRQKHNESYWNTRVKISERH